jgi:hypothetical protein
MIIGLTGRRGVGKSTIADALVERGFVRAHPFAGGKAMSRVYFCRLGATVDEAHRMTDGDLKDTPSRFLPHHSTPRHFMEKFGYFMGVTMGPEWTLGAELDSLAWLGARGIVVESIVYEAEALRRRGGVVVRILRPDVEGPSGEETDKAEATIDADYTVINQGSLRSIPDLVDSLLKEIEG